jgi:hypothetical protein
MNEKPTPPGEYDCCESGCEPCIWDTYNEQLREWNEQEAARKKKAEESVSENENA